VDPKISTKKNANPRGLHSPFYLPGGDTHSSSDEGAFFSSSDANRLRLICNARLECIYDPLGRPRVFLIDRLIRNGVWYTSLVRIRGFASLTSSSVLRSCCLWTVIIFGWFQSLGNSRLRTEVVFGLKLFADGCCPGMVSLSRWSLLVSFVPCLFGGKSACSDRLRLIRPERFLF
jgi:hypothetical protein